MSSRVALSAESLLVDNLRLLGYTPGEGEHFGADMFRRPNEKALHHILYFLLTQLSRKHREGFQYVWPVNTSVKSEFKRIVQDYLSELEKQGHLPMGSSQPSRINSAFGTRTVDLVLHLSTHILKKSIEKRFPAYNLRPCPRLSAAHQFCSARSLDVNSSSRDNSSDNYLSDVVQVTKEKIYLVARRFHEHCARIDQVEKEWEVYATHSQQEMLRLQKREDTLQDDRVELKRTSEPLGDLPSSTDSLKVLHRLRAAWQGLQIFQSSSAFRNVEKVLVMASQSSVSDPILDGSVLLPPSRSETNAQVSLKTPNLAQTLSEASALLEGFRDSFSKLYSCMDLLPEGDVSGSSALTGGKFIKLFQQQVNGLNAMLRDLEQSIEAYKETNERRLRENLQNTVIEPFYDDSVSVPSSDDFSIDGTPNRAGSVSRMELIPPTPATKYHLASPQISSSDSMQALLNTQAGTEGEEPSTPALVSSPVKARGDAFEIARIAESVRKIAWNRPQNRPPEASIELGTTPEKRNPNKVSQRDIHSTAKKSGRKSMKKMRWKNECNSIHSNSNNNNNNNNNDSSSRDIHQRSELYSPHTTRRLTFN